MVLSENMKKIILILILLLAALLRFYQLDSYPALNADEAAIGYNAYSLIETGKDEHGNSWPIHFQSFNDYKPGLYFYLVLPFVKVLGLNEWAVRIPGALLGVATVLVIYFLVSELFSKENHQSPNTLHHTLASLAALMLAISPWHIHFSRGGWETNVAIFFITCGIWLFLKAIKNPKFFAISFSFFVLSLYTYHAARIVTPLMVLGLLFCYRKDIKRNLKMIVMSGLIALFLLIPLGLNLTKGAGYSRAAGVGLFADPGPLARINEQRGEHGNFKGLVSILLHNKPVNYTLAFLENWGEHFAGEFLFLTGDEIERNKVPETGQMYIIDILWMVFGVWWIVKSINMTKGMQVIVLWLVVAPVAAALTFQSPHALRAQNMVIPLVIISAYGLFSIIGWLRKQKRYFLVIGHWSLVILIAWQFTRYLHMYYLHMSKEYPFSSQYGVKELVSYLNNEGGKYEKIVVTDEYDQPYILFLFYLHYPPEKFQGEHALSARDKFGFSTVSSFDKYTFKDIVFDSDKVDYPKSLIVGTDKEIPNEANVVKEIHGTNGYKYFDIVAN